jgi:repressor LexA
VNIVDKGARIKELRESKQISQTELADMIGTTKQNVYKYENNIITNIPSDKIELMAEKFDVSPAYIMGWTNEKSTPIMQNDRSAVIKRINDLPDDQFEKLADRLEGYLDGLSEK